MIISWDAIDWSLSALSIYILLPSLFMTLVYLGGIGRDTKEKTNLMTTTLKSLLKIYTLSFLGMLLMSVVLILPAVGPWEEIKRGTYDRVEYTDTRVKKAPVGYRMVHRTIIHFADGQSVVLPGEYSIEFPKGTELKILTKNNFYKIKKAE